MAEGPGDHHEEGEHAGHEEEADHGHRHKAPLDRRQSDAKQQDRQNPEEIVDILADLAGEETNDRQSIDHAHQHGGLFVFGDFGIFMRRHLGPQKDLGVSDTFYRGEIQRLRCRTAASNRSQ